MVIFVAILNFITAAFGVLIMGIALIGVIFGNIVGIAEYLSRQMTEYSQSVNLSVGISVLFWTLLLLGALVAVSSVIVGLALLKGRRWAWYVQIASSVLGLLGFPYWTVLNGLILLFFFGRPIREYFKV